MTFQGLENNYYLINNPIYLEIKGLINQDAKFLLTIQIGSISTEVQMYNNYAYLDLSPFVKTLMDTPNLFQPNSNILNIDIIVTYFDYDLEQGILVPFNNKVFLRGGRYTGRNNHLSDGYVLKESTLIPTWSGFPVKKYSINGSTIQALNVPADESELMRAIICDGIYITWLNSLGGYSYFFFENYEVNKKYKSGEIIKRDWINSPQNNFYDLGGEVDYSINVSDKVFKRHFALINSLVESSEIWIYKFQELIDDTYIEDADNQWVKVYGDGNNNGISSREDIEEVSLSFKTMFNKNISLV